VTAPPTSWSPGEAATINEFLNTPLGQKWIGVLMAQKPRLDPNKVSVEQAAITGAYIAGFEQVFLVIASTRIALKDKESASRPGIDPSRD
jgi:hypothetical protein